MFFFLFDFGCEFRKATATSKIKKEFANYLNSSLIEANTSIYSIRFFNAT